MRPHTLILHHDDTDGRCAAWCVLQHYPDAECLAVNYGDEPPVELATDRDVWIVDFSWPSELLRMLESVAKSLTVIDHHKTARRDLQGLIPLARMKASATLGDHFTARNGDTRVFFDLERSGCGLTWDVLNHGRARPWFVDYVEDRDLWSWKLADSKAVNAYLSTLSPFPESFAGLFYPEGLSRSDIKTDPPRSIISAGEAVLRYQDKTIQRICKHARPMMIEDYVVPSVNSPVLQSEIGNELAQGALFSAVWFTAANGRDRVSLRSVESGLDVGKIANRLGGGGHKHAAGFEV